MTDVISTPQWDVIIQRCLYISICFDTLFITAASSCLHNLDCGTWGIATVWTDVKKRCTYVWTLWFDEEMLLLLVILGTVLSSWDGLSTHRSGGGKKNYKIIYVLLTSMIVINDTTRNHYWSPFDFRVCVNKWSGLSLNRLAVGMYSLTLLVSFWLLCLFEQVG